MGNWKATKLGINLLVKSWTGLPHRSFIHQSWMMSTDDFWCYQADAFTRMYAFARTRVPFYKQRPDMYPAITADKEHVLEVLAQLPILGKQVVRKHNSALWPDPPLRLTKINTTSGTTGTPLRLPSTLPEKGFLQAIIEDWHVHITGSRRPRTLNLTGFVTPSPVSKELFWHDRLLGQVYLSIYSLTSANREAIIKLFDNFKPQLIYGYPSSIHQLALLLGDRIQRSNQERIAVTSSEVLQPQWRTAIESSLCRKVFDLYGAQEGSHFVTQCEAGSMHINPLVGIVETVGPDGKPAKPGEIGKVLVTGLIRRSMPLIRYDIGDTVESTGYATNCPCGLKWPTIGRIDGRAEDMVKTTDGRHVGYLCFHATKELRGIKEAQIVQTGYEQFICNIVKSETDQVENDYLENGIRSQIVKRLQLPVDIEFRYHSSLPRGRNGKFKAVVVDFDGDEVNTDVGA